MEPAWKQEVSRRLAAHRNRKGAESAVAAPRRTRSNSAPAEPPRPPRAWRRAMPGRPATARCRPRRLAWPCARRRLPRKWRWRRRQSPKMRWLNCMPPRRRRRAARPWWKASPVPIAASERSRLAPRRRSRRSQLTPKLRPQLRSQPRNRRGRHRRRPIPDSGRRTTSGHHPLGSGRSRARAGAEASAAGGVRALRRGLVDSRAGERYAAQRAHRGRSRAGARQSD